MYWRLLAAGAKGIYVPDLIIYHYIHPDRLTKRYFRRWHFWRGVSSGFLDRRQPQPVPYLLGVPRHLVGRATRGSFGMLKSLGLRRDPSETFMHELKVVDLAGFFYGRLLYKPSDV